jgi:8-oxo-dGTP diphosphatase
MSDSERPAVRVVSAEIQRDGQYLITQRQPHAVLPLLWEFPGGRVRDGETDEQALTRNIRDRLGVELVVEHQLLEVTHDYDSYSLILTVYRCELGDQEPRAGKVAALAWVAPEDFADYPFPSADQQSVDLLLKED